MLLSAASAAVHAIATRAIVAESTTSAPSVTSSSPANGATNVQRDISVTLGLHLPNGALDASTVNGYNVALELASSGTVVGSVVNTTGGNDAIILTPYNILSPQTAYKLVVSSNVKDVSGASLAPFSMIFTTGSDTGAGNLNVAFQQVALGTATGVAFTCVRIGPDGLLYASSEDGRIFRYPINTDGTLGIPQVSSALQTANGGARLITGFAFDPHSTASNVTLWVSNSYYGFTNAPDFSGKITVMSGADLGTVQDAVINLPRSNQDHSTEQPTFGPDGALYFAQGSNSSTGAPDAAWGNRSEHLLTAAILRLDTSKITPGQPLNVLTTDAGGKYNPNAAGAPLTIYATGIRNAFQILWTSNGQLLAPTNGASSGGNAPGFPNSVNGQRIDIHQNYSGPSVPALTNITETESDYLYTIAKGGYYGHPDPARGEYVLDGANPTSGVDPAEFVEYPVGTKPDANYRFATYDLGPHRSPDGILEYSDKTFGGLLQNALFIADYSAGNDISILLRDSSGNITADLHGLSGLTDLNNPVNIAEDPNTGNVYVAELGGQRLELLRPQIPGPHLSAGTNLVAFNSIAAGNSGAAPSPSQTITITNTGNATLNISLVSIAKDPADASNDASAFQVVSAPPSSIAAGQSATMQVRFTAGRVGVESALLQIQSNDASYATTTIALRGLGTQGQFGNLEPSLQYILDLYQIPDNVGDPNPSDATFPTQPAQPNDEVLAQQFTKAGNGPVSIQVLASFGIGSPIVSRMGYYSAGSPAARTELFSVGQADQQTVDPTPLGATSFDPGSALFGLFAAFPHFIDPASDGSLVSHERYSYSEDAFNLSWDPNNPRKMRAYPLKNVDGSVVPNAYVVAIEDYNQSYDSNDLVAIVRNVTPDTGPVLGLENMDESPAPDQLVFNRINILDTTSTAHGDIVHDTNTLRIHNTGNQPLKITSLALSDPTAWEIVNPPALPATVAPNGGSLDLTVKFIDTKNPSHTDNQTNDTATTNGISPANAGGVYSGTLTIGSNDSHNSSRVVQLNGYWQYQSAHENEPSLQTIVNKVFGFGTQINSTPIAQLTESTSPIYYGEEYHATSQQGLWSAADPSQPVKVEQIAAFHNQGTTAKTSWYNVGGSSTELFQHVPDESQSLLPQIEGTTNPAIATFTPSGAFGFNLDGEYSEDSRNTTDKSNFNRSGHAVRFYPLRSGTNNRLVPNAWLMVMDYQNSEFDNDDFQDLAYIVTNMRPATAPPTPTDLEATVTGAGVMLQWAPASYSSAVSYTVSRSINGAAPVALTQSAISNTSYVDPSPPAGTTGVKYYVTATSGGASSMLASATVNLASQSITVGSTPPPTGGGGFSVTMGPAQAIKAIKFKDADGTVAVLSLSGAGSATIYFGGSNQVQVGKKGTVTINGPGLTISSISCTGTTTKSSFTVTTHGGNNAIDIGALTSDGALKAISAKAANLTGNLSAAGSIAKIQLGSASNGTISVGQGAAVSLQMTSATSENFTSAAPVASIVANQWIAGATAAGTITIPSIKSISIQQNAGFAIVTGQIGTLMVRGTLSGASLSLTGPVSKSYDLATLNAGSIVNSTIQCSGNIRSIHANSMTGSAIYAGIGTLTSGQNLPNTAAQFTSAATIASLTILHKASPGFANSEIAASILTHIDLGNVAYANGGKSFGISARRIGSLTATDAVTGAHLSLSNVAKARALANQLKAQNASLGDMTIEIV